MQDLHTPSDGHLGSILWETKEQLQAYTRAGIYLTPSRHPMLGLSLAFVVRVALSQTFSTVSE